MPLRHMPRDEKNLITFVVITLVVAASLVVGYALVATADITRLGALARHTAAPASDSKARICNAVPPDYPGCSVGQVEDLAKGDATEWFKKKRYGVANSVLEQTNLTSNQIAQVEAAMRAEVRDVLQRMAGKSVRRGNAESKRVWTTGFRGQTYTINTFPYGDYVDKIMHGDSESGFNACWIAGRQVVGEFMYNMCLQGNIPQTWTYWQNWADAADDPGSSASLPCAKEVVIGAASGSATGAIASIWSGPGMAAGAGIGGVSVGGGALVGCAVGHLGDWFGWWDYPKWRDATKAQRRAMIGRFRNELAASTPVIKPSDGAWAAR